MVAVAVTIAFPVATAVFAFTAVSTAFVVYVSSCLGYFIVAIY